MNGDWFKKVDGDDILYPHAIEELVNATKEIDDIRTIVFMKNEFIDENGNKTTDIDMYYNNYLSGYEHLLYVLAGFENFYGDFNTNLVHKSVFDNIGKFDEKFGLGEDNEMILRICAYKYNFHYIPRVIQGYRIHSGQTSGSTAHPEWLFKAKKLPNIDENKRMEIKNDLKKHISDTRFNAGIWLFTRTYSAPWLSSELDSSLYHKSTSKNIFFMLYSKSVLRKLYYEHYRLRSTFMFLQVLRFSITRLDTTYIRGWLWARKNKTHPRVKDISSYKFHKTFIFWNPMKKI